jgi:serine/threonine-protein kinase RsbW
MNPFPAPAFFWQEIPSRMADADSLCLKIRDLLQTKDLGQACFAVELLARECLNNAVIHGNRNNADKFIMLRLWVGRAWIRLQISDEGPGFAWRKAKRKRLDTHAPSGRGLQLCDLYAGRVRFNRSGNQITLWINKKKSTRKDECNGRLRNGTE